MKNIKILICYHKPDILLKDEILTPIHVGRALAIKNNNPNLIWLQENMIGDDTGDNISYKNSTYNELTAVYWAWKNYKLIGDPDYIGLMHYRRHFIFDKEKKEGVYDFDEMGEEYLQSIHYSRENIEELLSNCDFIYHQGKVGNIYKHYSEYHNIKDLDLALEILKEKYQEYSVDSDTYISQSKGCFCNMTILPREMFFEYCEWLFSILLEFERRVDISDKRLFISERLTGIFIEHQKRVGKKAISLSASFVKSPIKIPIFIDFDTEIPFLTAVTLNSMFVNANENTTFDVRLITKKKMKESEVFWLNEMKAKYKNFTFSFINIAREMKEWEFNWSGDMDYILLPILLSKIALDVGKGLYLSNNILVTKDLEEFFRICSVDDFWLVGIPNLNSKIDKNNLSEDIYMMNFASMRKNNVFETFINGINNNKKDLNSFAKSLLSNKSHIMSKWLYFYSDNDNNLYLDSDIKYSRAERQSKVLKRSFICYNAKYPPYLDIQGLYSKFWWDIASQIPEGLNLPKVNFEKTEELLRTQQISINANHKRAKIIENKYFSVFKRTINYFQKNGAKATVRKIVEKLFGAKK